ncbi:hypothetical protein WICPIJ_004276 [Wickerhamomyces pijperi]|uniref:Uncharacterized protein n=1 Tax=Wickerhamomyces pijperi TaxID=599730 RepID=A0A9P8Q886_WICPI|nr:hypothetical protein WICPIJ_004276 [Wickerhamomyces pijperi]
MKIIKANGPPRDKGKLVTKMKTPPRLLVDSLAASEEEEEQAAYSPPTPNPMAPRQTIIIQNIPVTVAP